MKNSESVWGVCLAAVIIVFAVCATIHDIQVESFKFKRCDCGSEK